MAKTNYIAANDNAFAAQLNLFKNKIGDYAATVGVTAAQKTTQAADADYFNYLLQCQEMMQTGAQQWTAWKDLTRDGGTLPPTGAPVLPTLPAAVPSVAPGVEARFRALAKAIKAHANYNQSIGEALGIEGAQQVAPDLTVLKPEIQVLISGNRVEVDWGWQGNSAFLDLCELQVDRGDGKGFALLAYDTTPGYVDTAPFPATPTKWTYKAIYRVGDAQTGQWSNPVSLIVGG
jgi:hypothetical protein